LVRGSKSEFSYHQSKDIQLTNIPSREGIAQKSERSPVTIRPASMPNSDNTISEEALSLKCAAYCTATRFIVYVSTAAFITFVIYWALLIILESWL